MNFAQRFREAARGMRAYKVAHILNDIRPVGRCSANWQGSTKEGMAQGIPNTFDEEEQELILKRLQEAREKES